MSVVTSLSITHVHRPVECPQLLADLISQCTRIQSEDRPTFNEILKFCEGKQATTTICIEQPIEI